MTTRRWAIGVVIGVLAMHVAGPPRAAAHPGGHGGHDGEDGHVHAPIGRPPLATGAGSPWRLVAGPRRSPAGGGALADVSIDDAFAPFAERGDVTLRREEGFFIVESRGMPDHPLMVGIRTWQQQVPLPHPYEGDNAWRIPLEPVPAKNPATAKNRFLRGAIALAVNGVPIFNPLNNRGEDAYAIGELDDFGGHCGRADDYHYHIAPVHLEQVVGQGKPIAWALDGYPIYGSTEPDGSPVAGLDPLNGHEDAQGNYHYHATKAYPYLNGGFHGEVVERDGQVDPQPAARPVREAGRPLRGAKIVGFEATGDTARKLTYDVAGRQGTVEYEWRDDGSASFRFTDPRGGVTEDEARPRRRPGGGGRGGERDRPPPREEGVERDVPPPRGERRRPGPPRDEPPGERRGRPEPPRRPAGARAAKGEGALPVSSAGVGDDGRLGAEFTCDGDGTSPPISWEAGPVGTVEYAVVLWHEAPDRLKTYWVVHGIPADVRSIPAGGGEVGTPGLNDRGWPGYDPPCSRGPGVKTYQVTVYALSRRPVLPARGATREALLESIRTTTLAEGTLSFEYERAGEE